VNWLTESFSSSPLPEIELDFGDENLLLDFVPLEDIFVHQEEERGGESRDNKDGPIIPWEEESHQRHKLTLIGIRRTCIEI